MELRTVNARLRIDDARLLSGGGRFDLYAVAGVREDGAPAPPAANLRAGGALETVKKVITARLRGSRDNGFAQRMKLTEI